MIARWRGPHTREFRELFEGRSSVERLATGFRFIEGPVWMPQLNGLLFSDIPANRIWQWTPARGTKAHGTKASGAEIFREPSDHSNGLTRDAEGRLLICEHGKRRVTRLEENGTGSVLADTFGGKPLNSPNDIVVKSDGAIYFTDPIYGIQASQQEQPMRGVYRLSPDGSTLSVVADDFEGPNGLAFSPDERRLYINDSTSRSHIRVFDVNADGTLSNGRVFYQLKGGKRGASPDGIKVDSEGRLYCAAAGGVWVFDARGNHLGTIRTPEQPANCAWGDDDYRSLFITARTSLYRVRLTVAGIPA